MVNDNSQYFDYMLNNDKPEFEKKIHISLTYQAELRRSKQINVTKKLIS